MTLRTFIFSSLMLCASGLWSQSHAAWSGRVQYHVEPAQLASGMKSEMQSEQWDYLPQEVTWETDGTRWRLIEKGTSFERLWYGQFEAQTYHVLFHFLSHAVELLEPCPPSISASRNSDGLSLGLAPCAWPAHSLPVEIELTDGPATYRLVLDKHEAIASSQWKRNHFRLPSGYEPVDKLTLAALLSRLDTRSE